MNYLRLKLRPLIRGVWNIINFFRWPYIDLAVILWPPAEDHFSEIIEDIKKIYPVLSEREFEIQNGSMKEFMIKLYAIDRASEKKISLKIDRLLVPPHKLKIIKIRIPWPAMKSHSDLNHWVKCPKVNQLKHMIRKKYSPMISDYKYDVIIHSTETDDQIEEVENLIIRYSKLDMQLENIKLLPELNTYDIPKNDYVLLNSAWLPIFNIRKNGDLDLLPSNSLYQKLYSANVPENSSGLPGDWENKIRFHGLNSPYMQLTSAKTTDEFISKYSVKIKNVNFVIPRLYIEYKINRLRDAQTKISKLSFIRRKILKERYAPKNTRKLFRKSNKDSADLKKIAIFFSLEKHKSSELPPLSDNDWGTDLVKPFL